MAPEEYELIRAAFERWLASEGGSNTVELERVRRMLPIILNECCTDTQKKYILRYFADNVPVSHIAEEYGVNRSTVSRTIHRGLARAFDRLRFVSPRLAYAPMWKGRLTRRRRY